MSNPIIYTGSPGPISGSTPFGFYDNDLQFQVDGPRVANYCAIKLGYPVLDVELSDKSFYVCFEEATSIYAEELYQSVIKDNYLTLQGSPTSSVLNNTVISPNLTNIINISETYGAEAGVGGFVNWSTGSLITSGNVQEYDMYQWAVNTQGMDPSDRIVIQRVFFQEPPAIYGYGYGSYYPELGGAGAWPGDWGGYGQGSGVGGGGSSNSATLYPVYWDIQRIQELEMSNEVRLPAFSFELIGSKLRIIPVPELGSPNIVIQYAFQSQLMSLTGNSPYGSNQGLVANPALAPYTNITYSQINQPGKQWIKEYTAALTSELLGLVRGKYTSVPIPGETTTLNHADLISRGQAMQKQLRDKLQKDLDDMSRSNQLKKKKEEAESLHSTMQETHLQVYLG